MAKIKEFKPMKERLANGLTWTQTCILTMAPVAAQTLAAIATVAAAVINAQAAANNLAAMQQQANNIQNTNK